MVVSVNATKGKTQTKKQNKNKRLHLSLRNGLFHPHVTPNRSREVFNYYEIVSDIAEGSMARVWCVQKKKKPTKGKILEFLKGAFKYSVFSQGEDDSNKKGHRKRLYALKSIQKGMMTRACMKEMINELDILIHLDHPNIVRVYESFESKRQIYIVMELCSGGNLFSRSPYTEKQAQRIMSQVLSAVAYMHKNNVVHRCVAKTTLLGGNGVLFCLYFSSKRNSSTVFSLARPHSDSSLATLSSRISCLRMTVQMQLSRSSTLDFHTSTVRTTILP